MPLILIDTKWPQDLQKEKKRKEERTNPHHILKEPLEMLCRHLVARENMYWMVPVNINKLLCLKQLSSKCRVEKKAHFCRSLSLRFKPRCFTSHLRQTKTRHVLSYGSWAAAQEKVLFINELNQPNSQLPQGGFAAPQPGCISFNPSLHSSKSTMSQSREVNCKLLFTKTSSVLLLTGSVHHPGTHCRDKETRKAGAAQFSAAASHKLCWIVSSSYMLTA